MIDWKAYDIKNFTCHKAGLNVIKHELHVIKHVLPVMKQKKKRKLLKIRKCEIWYENIFVKRTFLSF